MSWGRTYQVCRHDGCANWIWEDRVQDGFTCRKCGCLAQAHSRVRGEDPGFQTSMAKTSDGLCDTAARLESAQGAKAIQITKDHSGDSLGGC